MIRVIIVDDEKKCRDSMQELLKQYCKQVEVLAECSSVKEGVEAIETYKPDLIFLDVEMTDGTGFDLLEKVSNKNFDVIFATGFDQYAVKAFKFSALDYLLKPVLSDDLINAVTRYENKKGKVDTNQQLNLLLSNLKGIKTGLNKIAIPTSDGLTFLEVENIFRLEADSNYTTFYTTTGKYLVSKTLKEYDELLSENNFLRIHQSHLVNLSYVKKYVRGEGGYVGMNDGTTVPVSARKKSEVLERLAHF